jgi:hypothetical protein
MNILDELPDEMIREILEKTDPGTVDISRQVSKKFQSIVDEYIIFDSPFECYYIDKDLNKIKILKKDVDTEEKKLKFYQIFGKYRLINCDENFDYLITKDSIQNFDDLLQNDIIDTPIKKLYNTLRNINEIYEYGKLFYKTSGYDYIRLMDSVTNDVKYQQQFTYSYDKNILNLLFYNIDKNNSNLVKHNKYENIQYKIHNKIIEYSIQIDDISLKNIILYVYCSENSDDIEIYIISLEGIITILFSLTSNEIVLYKVQLMKSNKIKYYNCHIHSNFFIFFDDKNKVKHIKCIYENPVDEQCVNINTFLLYNDRYLDMSLNYLIDIIENKLIINDKDQSVNLQMPEEDSFDGLFLSSKNLFENSYKLGTLESTRSFDIF